MKKNSIYLFVYFVVNGTPLQRMTEILSTTFDWFKRNCIPVVAGKPFFEAKEKIMCRVSWLTSYEPLMGVKMFFEN